MEENILYTPQEREQLRGLVKTLQGLAVEKFHASDYRLLKNYLTQAVNRGILVRNAFGLHPIILDLQTALLVAKEVGARRDIALSILLHDIVRGSILSLQEAKEQFGESVVYLLESLVKISELYAKNPTIESDNFKDLLLSFAKDLRVIMIMIADRLNLMRQIGDTLQVEARQEVSHEVTFLYAPLAHKLGLYAMKGELNDLALKYTEPEVYQDIYDKLQATKASREDYIGNFIKPIDEKLKAAGLKFHIKGRTKAIHSIWEKMKRQKQEFENIYDLFAIRIIIDTPIENEKAACWQAYSIATDMYQPNPNRLRDWISIPKRNGYESLHITVMGPDGKWVEIQIRTERMDAIAEHGLAAHWRYKGIKDERGFDEWLKSIRETLESSATEQGEMNDKFKMELYKDDVFIFTPKGDLFRLPKGATVLDFAFNVHTNIGYHCIGARVNGRNVQLRQVLTSGDQVEITTSASQMPKQGWLDMVTTSRAKSKIRQALKEVEAKQSAFAKEEIERKFKNHKIEYDEGRMNQLARKMGFKQLTPFYQRIAEGLIDVNKVMELYQAMDEHGQAETPESAQNWSVQQAGESDGNGKDVLVIDRNLQGVNYKLGKCCNPVFGDKIFGFVTVSGGITIHRESCPNAPQLYGRYGYRVVSARWSDKGKSGNGSLYPITLHLVGNDDIGVVNGITSVISKEENILMRSINIDSHDGLFTGTLTLMVDDVSRLKQIIKQIGGVKGIKQVKRS